jgi:isopenicillin N synthase-like dioxygenase
MDAFEAVHVARPALPVINIGAGLSSDSTARRAVADAMRAACLDKGFFYISGHGVARSSITGIFEQSRRFFDQPDGIKYSVDKANSPANRGYERPGAQTLEKGAHPDLKESYYIGRDLSANHPLVIAGRFNHGANVWPEDMPEFKRAAETYYDAMRVLAEQIIRTIALALDLEESYFDEFCRDPLANLRLLRYPPHPIDADPGTRGAGAHTDFGCITILLQDDSGGLQVFDRANNAWIHAAPIPGTFVVNLGDLVERWTNGRFASTRHRVINSSGHERHSVAFFFSGNPDYKISCLPGCLRAGDEPAYPSTTVEAHLRECYQRTYDGK